MRRIHKFYESIAHQHCWHCTKQTSEIPLSRVTQYARTAGPAIFGEYNSCKFALVGYRGIEGRYITDYTVIGAKHRGTSGTAYISGRGIPYSILQTLGRTREMQEIKLGDEAFDSMFWIRGDFPSIGSVLDSAIRQKLINLLTL